jgi:MSHA biogenesis protein MshP
MKKTRYKALDTRSKVQGTRNKAQEGSLAPCILIEQLAIRLGWRTTPAKSLVMHLASAQSGFSLISAIFLLVVIAALGTFAVTLSTTQQQSSALDVLGSRAYQASRAGIEWSAYQAINGAIACGTFAAPVSTNVTLTGTTLQNFTVVVQCGSAAASEASATVTMYQIISTATQGAVATPNYVERQMSVTIAR